MSTQERHLFNDILFLTVSIGFAVFIVKIGMVREMVEWLDSLRWLGIIFAGAFFTSAFTTAPAIALLSTFAETIPLAALAVLGGFGAVCGDYVIFRFAKDRIAQDFKYLLSFSKRNRFSAIFQTRIFRFFVPFLGALIIASPLPDEIGITMLGLSNMKDKIFFLISFLANGTGIFIIGWIAKTVSGL
ncbi:MAG: hypothetical protein HZC04_01190 [Candidatus Lloydbacteria bacterium]|nr:hypothetical protein [Candidatus Lloydbacteria bacterium]